MEGVNKYINAARDEYLKKINIYKNELAFYNRERDNLRNGNEFYPTRSLDVKIAHRKKMIKVFMAKYEETYRVRV